jgi:hypothetical protein
MAKPRLTPGGGGTYPFSDDSGQPQKSNVEEGELKNGEDDKDNQKQKIIDTGTHIKREMMGPLAHIVSIKRIDESTLFARVKTYHVSIQEMIVSTLFIIDTYYFRIVQIELNKDSRQLIWLCTLSKKDDFFL